MCYLALEIGLGFWFGVRKRHVLFCLCNKRLTLHTTTLERIIVLVTTTTTTFRISYVYSKLPTVASSNQRLLFAPFLEDLKNFLAAVFFSRNLDLYFRFLMTTFALVWLVVTLVLVDFNIIFAVPTQTPQRHHKNGPSRVISSL